MIEVLGGIVIYLLLGTATLVVMKWHDRTFAYHDIFEQWLDDDNDMDGFVVALFPLIWLMGAFILIVDIIPRYFAKGVMIAATAIVYLLKAIVKGEPDGEDKARKDKRRDNDGAGR